MATKKPRATRTSEIKNFAGIGEPIKVTRSRARRSTITARRKDGIFEILIPASLSALQETQWVQKMHAKYAAGTNTSAPPSDSELFERALMLAHRYLPEGVEPASVRWVTNQTTRWGSCSGLERTIRLSHELKEMPQYVIDSVLVHELAHLVHPHHGPSFRELESRFERFAEAKAFLAGVSFARGRGPA